MPYEARDRHICDHKGPEETIAGRVISALQGADVSQLFECAANRCFPTRGRRALTLPLKTRHSLCEKPCRIVEAYKNQF
jgi:hypothetical protein